MSKTNKIKIEIKALLENVSIARVAISSFISTLDVTIDELMDIKTAISEAVTNAVEHAYREEELEEASVVITAYIYSGDDDIIKVEVEDNGMGIDDIETAMLPTYTSKPELEHAGMGFTIMETFMDEILIDSNKGVGTKVTLTRKLKKKKSKVV